MISADQVYYYHYGQRRIRLSKLAEVIFDIIVAHRDRLKYNVQQDNGLIRVRVGWLQKVLKELGVNAHPISIGSAISRLHEMGLIRIRFASRSGGHRYYVLELPEEAGE